MEDLQSSLAIAADQYDNGQIKVKKQGYLRQVSNKFILGCL